MDSVFQICIASTVTSCMLHVIPMHVFPTACSSSQWMCSNGQCISAYNRCDGDQECSDGSDEHGCCKQCAN